MASLDRWDDYTAAKEAMFDATDTDDVPWTVVKSNDKRRARLNAMRHLLHLMEYADKDAGRHRCARTPASSDAASALHESDERAGRRLPAG